MKKAIILVTVGFAVLALAVPAYARGRRGCHTPQIPERTNVANVINEITATSNTGHNEQDSSFSGRSLYRNVSKQYMNTGHATTGVVSSILANVCDDCLGTNVANVMNTITARSNTGHNEQDADFSVTSRRSRKSSSGVVKNFSSQKMYTGDALTGVDSLIIVNSSWE